MQETILKVHYPAGGWRALYLIGTVIGVVVAPLMCNIPVLLVGTVLEVEPLALSAMMVAMGVSMVGLVLWSGYRYQRHARIVVSVEGLSMYGTGTRRARWEELSHFGYDDDLDDKREWGIWTHGGSRKRTFFPLSRYMRVPVTRRNRQRDVDVGAMALTPLGRDLYQHAPHLFYAD